MSSFEHQDVFTKGFRSNEDLIQRAIDELLKYRKDESDVGRIVIKIEGNK